MTHPLFISAPTYDGKDYCLSEFSSCVSRLFWPGGKSVMMIDTSDDAAHTRKLRSYGLEATALPKASRMTGIAKMTNAMEMARGMFLGTKSEFWLVWESDLMADPMAAIRLYNLGCDAAAGLYFVSRGKDAFLMPTAYYTYGTGQISQYIPYHELFSAPVAHANFAGLGFVLLHRSIVSQVGFWQPDSHDTHDLHFWREVNFRTGKGVAIDTTQIITHKNSWVYGK